METKAEVPPPPPQPQRITANNMKQQQAGKIANAGPNGVASQVKPLVKAEPANQMDQSFGSQNEDRKSFNQNHGNNQGGGNRQNFGGRGGRGMGNRFGGGRGGPGGGNNRNFQQNRNQNQNQDVSGLRFKFVRKFLFSKWLPE